MNKKRILICGAGSIGVFLGAELNLNGHEVILFGRRKLKGVKETVFINGREYDVSEKVFRLPKNERFDFIFITSKLYDFDKIVNLIKKNNIQSKVVSSVQNGLVDASKQSKILGKKIMPVVVFSGFNLNNGKIKVTPTKFGWISENSKAGKAIGSLLKNAQIPCRALGKFESLRAEKTIVNSCLNSLSAIENRTFIELFKNNKTRERIDRLFNECYNILSKDYSLRDFNEMKKEMFKTWSKLPHYSSTCQDIRSGRKNEARYFNGYVVELGKKQGIPAQENLKILSEIKNLEKGNV